MNICMVTSASFPPAEGIGNYVYNLSKNLLKKGHNVTIITRGSSKIIQQDSSDGIEILKSFFIPIYPFHVNLHGIYVNKIFKSMEKRFDIVHFHTPLPPYVETTLPKITTVHTPMLIDTRYIEQVNLQSIFAKVLGRFVSYPLELKLLNKSDIITTVSNSVAKELIEYGIDFSDCKVIGNGVNEKTFFPSNGNTENRYVLFIGRLSYRKGLFDLIDSSKYVISKYPDVRFVIVGNGNLSGLLQKKVEKLGLQEKFKFMGYVDSETLVKLYQNAAVFALPSHYEGLPTVLLEAMSCGLPVVATAISGNLDVISHFENGILVPPHSPEKLAEGISMLLDNDSLRKTLGKNARRTIEEHYTWDTISNKFLRCYESLLETV